MFLRSVLLLSLLGALLTTSLFSGQPAVVPSNQPVITDQAQFPPPGSCGLYPTCKDKKG